MDRIFESATAKIWVVRRIGTMIGRDTRFLLQLIQLDNHSRLRSRAEQEKASHEKQATERYRLRHWVHLVPP